MTEEKERLTPRANGRSNQTLTVEKDASFTVLICWPLSCTI